MDTILNLARLRKLMKDKPVGQRLWLFFKGYNNNLNKKQCDELIKLIEKETKSTIDFIKVNREKCES